MAYQRQGRIVYVCPPTMDPATTHPFQWERMWTATERAPIVCVQAVQSTVSNGTRDKCDVVEETKGREKGTEQLCFMYEYPE